MKENKSSTFFTWLLLAGTALLPVFFLPNLINPAVNSKLILVFLLYFVCCSTFLFRSLQSKSIKIVRTPFVLPLAVFLLLIVISSLVSHQYPRKELLGLGGVYISFASLILLAPSIVKANMSKWFILTLNIMALVLSILTILQLFGIGLPALINRISILNLPDSLAFSLTGATFIAIQFLSIVMFANVFDQKSWRDFLFNKISTVVIAIALGINIWAILPKGEASFQSLSFVSSVSIAKDSLTLTKNALFGYGPDSYGNAYNLLKPIWTNGLNYWKFTFDAAFDLPLTMIVSTGILACLVYLVFMWSVGSNVVKSKVAEPFLKAFILASLAWQFFAPLNLVTFILLAIAIVFFVVASRDQYKEIAWQIHQTSDVLNFGKWVKAKTYLFVGGVAVGAILLILAIYTAGKTFVAYHLLYRSGVSIDQNEIAKAYDYHKKAKELAPQLDFIRRSYSTVNLQIAIALSNKANITEAEQEQVLQLVNQAIREAKAATILDPANYQNWLALAEIYMQLAGTTKQAQQEAFSALARAIAYNPISPELRISLGRLFLSDKRYSEAATFFSQAVERKPDLFLAHYYLAKTLIANNQLTEAKVSLTDSLNLLARDSQEYQIVTKELDALNEQINRPAKTTTDSSSPKPTPIATASSLLNQKEAEATIQGNALTSDQNIIQN